MKKTISILLLILVNAVLLAGCIVERPLRGSFHKLCDSHADYVIMQKEGDLYIARPDLADSRRITFNPNEPKTDVTFTKNGQCIVYSVNRCCIEPKIIYYIQPINKDDNARSEITPEEFLKIRRK